MNDRERESEMEYPVGMDAIVYDVYVSLCHVRIIVYNFSES